MLPHGYFATKEHGAKFAGGDLDGVECVQDQSLVFSIQKKVQELCEWDGNNRSGFAGSQPVSMDIHNINFLEQKKYMVTWKADGTRYMMYINGKNRVYMIDRENSVFLVRNLTFPNRLDLLQSRHLENTLLDGEFVFDTNPETGDQIPRYMIYDVIQFEDFRIGKENFSNRQQCIENEIVQTRLEAMEQGRLNWRCEPFIVTIKQFYPICETSRLLSGEFISKLRHESDGLVYQPVDEPYKTGRCDEILKWKPSSMNSIDFRLNIVNRAGSLHGELYVGRGDSVFAEIEIDDTLRHLNNRIIECTLEDGQWKFMRERTDKIYPNAYKTAIQICDSIKNPVTKEHLVQITKSF